MCSTPTTTTTSGRARLRTVGLRLEDHLLHLREVELGGTQRRLKVVEQHLDVLLLPHGVLEPLVQLRALGVELLVGELQRRELLGLVLEYATGFELLLLGSEQRSLQLCRALARRCDLVGGLRCHEGDCRAAGRRRVGTGAAAAGGSSGGGGSGAFVRVGLELAERRYQRLTQPQAHDRHCVCCHDIHDERR